MSAPPEDPEVSALRQRVADLERRELVAQAQRIAPGLVIADGASAAELMASAVRHRHGVEAIDNVDPAEIRGMFRAMAIMAENPEYRAPRTPPRDARH